MLSWAFIHKMQRQTTKCGLQAPGFAAYQYRRRRSQSTVHASHHPQFAGMTVYFFEEINGIRNKPEEYSQEFHLKGEPKIRILAPKNRAFSKSISNLRNISH
jgi:hypothetical protein